MDSFLVTGGAGFVGSNLALMLKRDRPDGKVTVLDNLRRRGSELNVPRLVKAGVSFVHGDIRQADDFEQAGRFDLLIECSADASVLSGYDGSPAYVVQTNLGGTLNCLELCRRQEAGMLFFSTSRVYPMGPINELRLTDSPTRFKLSPDNRVVGASEDGISEDFPLAGARSIYGATKLCSELMIQEYAAAYGIKAIINRCGVLTGPWQMGKVDQGFVALWVARHLWPGALSYIGYGGTGKQVRDILHIADLYRLLAYQMDHLDELSGAVLNVGGGTDVSVSLLEMTALCQEVTGNEIPISSKPETREADIPYYVSDTRRAREATGWKPQMTSKQIVQDLCTWLRDHEDGLRSVFQ